MSKVRKTKGFSLVEILIAIGVLTVGMLFVAGTFAAALHFSKISTERTIGAVVADEAFAKIRLYGLREDSNSIDFGQFKELFGYSLNFENLFTKEISEEEFSYPSAYEKNKQYYWSAVCKLIDKDTRLVQVTVFVCRKTGNNFQYSFFPPNTYTPVVINRPVAIPIGVTWNAASSRQLEISMSQRNLVNDGSRILAGWNGQIDNVLERSKETLRTLFLKEPINIGPANAAQSYIWTVPPAVNGSGDPCIGVYQKVMRF